MSRPKNLKHPPTFSAPTKPAHLSVQAALEWDRLIREIEASALKITPAHRAAVALAATIAADIKTDWAEIQREGAYASSPKGGIVAHPALKRMDALRRDYIKVLSVIGLRPGTSAEPADGDSLDDVLNA